MVWTYIFCGTISISLPILYLLVCFSYSKVRSWCPLSFAGEQLASGADGSTFLNCSWCFHFFNTYLSQWLNPWRFKSLYISSHFLQEASLSYGNCTMWKLASLGRSSRHYRKAVSIPTFHFFLYKQLSVRKKEKGKNTRAYKKKSARTLLLKSASKSSKTLPRGFLPYFNLLGSHEVQNLSWKHLVEHIYQPCVSI